ncbi:hypothetical protein [Rhizobium sp. S96]|uniref:hypothetical protein n=1 Tax=Rhizobium sp. S96 TaxID=3055140 RepID=UPI0025AA5A75|nr:hypothetical protein [Rhizobium sp. S96]MDM9624018.1 hypothetical protein [Rhizobium sp. S96]
MPRVLTVVNIVLAVGLLACIGVTAYFAILVLGEAIRAQKLDQFSGLAIGALIAVVGTCLTALASLYTANRQAEVTTSVEEARAIAAADLAALQEVITARLDKFKADSAADLERLKKSLDFHTTAHRELGGSAAMYFYALRSAAIGTFDEAELERAETLMVETSRHLTYVSDSFEDEWLAFWQVAQAIKREAKTLADPVQRSLSVARGMESKDHGKMDLRDRYASLKEKAKREVS